MKLVAFFFAIGLTTSIYCFERQVKLKHGTVIGLSENVYGKDVNAFLGIPYAKPPINELRFRKPQPLTENWEHILNATTWSNECIQNQLPVTKLSEDCLYLNIWSPVNLRSNVTNNLKPVMVWIYGGGFTTGSISNPYYNASVLSTVGDVVVVTINYRLGALGFMFGGNDEMPGNMGLYDQSLAIEWIHENIAHFGGDKNLITIFGESAGSISVVYHLMSPISKPLFKNAIAMSGAATEYIATTSTVSATKIRNKLMKIVGCNLNDIEVVSNESLNCLRKLEAKRFVSKDLIDTDSKKPLSFSPVFGESFIPREPQQMWKDKQFKENISLLFGNVPNEGMLIVFDIGAVWHMNITGAQMMSLILEKRVFGDNFTLSPADIEEVIKFYFSGVPVEKQRDKLVKAFGDVYSNCPPRQFAIHFSEINKVHQYLLDFKAKLKIFGDCEACKPDKLSHGEEIPFTFGTSPYKEDIAITLKWIKIITDFAKTGVSSWPVYYRTKYGELITKYYHIKNTEEESEVLVGYRQAACQLWSAIFGSKR